MTVTECPSTDPRCQHTRPTDYGNYNCRCEPARRAFFRNRKKAHLNSTRRIDATGTRRRLQALKAIGWSGRELARRAEVGYATLDKVMYVGQPTVTVEIFDKVHSLYDEMWNTPGPSTQTRLAAAARDWPPPLFWDDDLIDDPTYLGESQYQQDKKKVCQLLAKKRNDIRADVADLSAKGWSASRIAEHLDCSTRRVVRTRTALRTAEVSESQRTLDDMHRQAS